MISVTLALVLAASQVHGTAVVSFPSTGCGALPYYIKLDNTTAAGTSACTPVGTYRSRYTGMPNSDAQAFISVLNGQYLETQWFTDSSCTVVDPTTVEYDELSLCVQTTDTTWAARYISAGSWYVGSYSDSACSTLVSTTLQYAYNVCSADSATGKYLLTKTVNLTATTVSSSSTTTAAAASSTSSTTTVASSSSTTSTTSTVTSVTSAAATTTTAVAVVAPTSSSATLTGCQRVLCQAVANTSNPLANCPANTILVSKDNVTYPNAFSTIQAAVLSLPLNDDPYNILILSGNYTEQVNVTRTGPLYLLGQTSSPNDKTQNSVQVLWAAWASTVGSCCVGTATNCTACAGDNSLTATLTVASTWNAAMTGSGPTGWAVPAGTPFGCTDFRTYNLDFVNNYSNYGGSPSLAVNTGYANTGFYRTRFYSFQDTVYIGKLGNAYFYDSEIAGQTDFFYGFGTAWIESSNITLRNCGGGITAWKGSNTTFTNAYGVYIVDSYVQKANSSLSITGKCALGRPWNSQIRSIFANNYFDDSILPAGFIEWTASTPRIDNYTFQAVYNNYGPGWNVTAETANYPITKVLSASTYAPYSTPSDVFQNPFTGVFGYTYWIDAETVSDAAALPTCPSTTTTSASITATSTSSRTRGKCSKYPSTNTTTTLVATSTAGTLGTTAGDVGASTAASATSTAAPTIALPTSSASATSATTASAQTAASSTSSASATTAATASAQTAASTSSAVVYAPPPAAATTTSGPPAGNSAAVTTSAAVYTAPAANGASSTTAAPAANSAASTTSVAQVYTAPSAAATSDTCTAAKSTSQGPAANQVTASSTGYVAPAAVGSTTTAAPAANSAGATATTSVGYNAPAADSATSGAVTYAASGAKATTTAAPAANSPAATTTKSTGILASGSSAVSVGTFALSLICFVAF
ncbi:hypothetical protein HDU82_003186 [Entophlyctis luteolus]|nr:hypothetical protein HDU82_003186 [Entophlyctis luteolus]KAJ3394558.1 hypothetical protein HDU84_007732 [Entophlyctis sp. JEL0112]